MTTDSSDLRGPDGPDVVHETDQPVLFEFSRTALQVHGEMGYTWEVDLHFFMKRALSLNAAWGLLAQHRKRMMERMLGAPTGPDALFAAALV